jgi:hypothetical protein
MLKYIEGAPKKKFDLSIQRTYTNLEDSSGWPKQDPKGYNDRLNRAVE